MKTYSDQIIKKMDDEIYPDLNIDFLIRLTNESKRGAVLIGTSRIEEYLEKLILFVLPKTSKTYTKKILDYPGIISSLSSKIELLYAFRMLDSKFYISLNILRNLRNLAAHTSESFELEHIKEKVDLINDFEEHFIGLIEELASDNLEKFKKKQIRVAVESGKGPQEFKEQVLKETFETLREQQEFKDQLIIWKLSYGMTLMCLKLLVLIDEYAELANKDLTWLEIIEKKNSA